MSQALGLVKASIKDALQYRLHYVVGIITTPITLLIFWFLWKSIFAFSNQELINGFTLIEMINYYTINAVIAGLTYTYVEEALAEAVRHGEVLSILLRPVNFFKWCFFSEKGDIVLRIGQTAIVLGIAAIFFSFKIYSLSAVLFFLLALFLALILSYIFGFIFGLFSFWFKRISGLRRLKKSLIAFLGGGLIPLAFFPGWLQTLSKYMPFEYIRSVPINIYLENIKGLEIFYGLIGQLVWIVIMSLIAFFIYKKAIRKFAGEGA